MITTGFRSKNMLSIILYLIHMATHVLSSTQFASHVSVNTPARSFTHGVGDPISVLNRRIQTSRQREQYTLRNSRNPTQSNRLLTVQGIGYPRIKPNVPFNREEIPPSNIISVSPWQYNNRELSIPVLPPSPYKVDSPDPESLWPEGLFIPPSTPPRIVSSIDRRSDIENNVKNKMYAEYQDPYLLEGMEAIQAVQRSIKHGKLYFHEIPHIDSLLANQEERVQNNLKPHILGSIRYTWPYYRT